MAFENRAEAGQMLARRLNKFRGQHPLVLAIPRGAVPMGKIVADALDGELDVVLVRKLSRPAESGAGDRIDRRDRHRLFGSGHP